MFHSVGSAVFLQLPGWLLLSFGFYFALRVLRFPDLTVEASFIAGSAGAAWGATAYGSSLMGLLMGAFLGALAGGITGTIYAIKQTSVFKLLSGVLVLFAFYSVNIRVLSLQTDVGFSQEPTAFNQLIDWEARKGWIFWRPFSTICLYIVATIIIVAVLYLLYTKSGLLIRSVGSRPDILRNSGVSPLKVLIPCLIMANTVVAIGGWCYGTINANTNITEFGFVIHALAAAIFGELLARGLLKKLSRRSRLWAVVLPPVLGATAYTVIRAFVIWLVVMGVGGDTETIWLAVRREDLNLLFALVLVGILVFGRLTRLTGYEAPRSEIDDI